ncbi:hypothetical protein UFOVP930_33 [uncultured Caudovirales phage]|uniref:Uncharacterized protein n=1 Tax=uncultured Caudovirales phage TaxID=2100421 RepID=A0A6J5PJB2_9CAUD|nr:hypothetical protein UFOVP930_33 [uncultured Caudovirales phage]CAB4200294.1 hypothetical protein UFOVP1354_33 [uncultured Caudovirales phage]CAB5238458.1 hypothetical protein UFOVP1547_22 [uncultured Caudovirales phage]
MNEAAEQAMARAAELLGEHFAEYVITCAQKASREPIIEHSGSVFAAKGLTDAAAYQLDVLGKCDDDDDGEKKWKDDGDDFTDGDPKHPA